MKLEYIKANGTYYSPQLSGVKDEAKRFGNHHVCLIKKLLLFGRWQIDYYDQYRPGGFTCGDENTPNARLIIYPSGIEEIKWSKES